MIDQHIATWKSRQRGRKLALWQGTGGFGDRLFATLEKRPGGNWCGSYGLEAEASFLSRKAAIREFSRRAADDHDVEVRTTTRIVCPRRLQPAGAKRADA